VAWSSEGARVIAKDFTVMQNPSLQFAALNGDYAFELPSNLNMQRIEKGPVVMVYLKDSLSIKTTVHFILTLKNLIRRRYPSKLQKAV
jgi:hypothetical protein